MVLLNHTVALLRGGSVQSASVRARAVEKVAQMASLALAFARCLELGVVLRRVSVLVLAKREPPRDLGEQPRRSEELDALVSARRSCGAAERVLACGWVQGMRDESVRFT